MPKSTWIIASMLSALLIFGYIGASVWQQKRQLEELHAVAEQSRAQIERLKMELSADQAHIIELQREKEAVAQAQKLLEQEMRAALESKDITISQLQGKLTVSILDRILFDSGEAVLKSEGEQVLQQIAAVLAQHPTRQIHVIGHTDNVPIRAGARNRFASNWELSTARATAAVRFLSEKAGVNPCHLGAVGYGEFHPLADNATVEGRAKNRRIALVVLSEELAGADTTPAVVPFAAAGSPTQALTNAVTTTATNAFSVPQTNLPTAAETNQTEVEPSTNTPAAKPETNLENPPEP
jgi:chemotaxis protein MotB